MNKPTSPEDLRELILQSGRRRLGGKARVDFQTVLSTERSLLTLEDSLASAEAARLTALVQLYKALGGGWSPADTATSGPQP